MGMNYYFRPDDVPAINRNLALCLESRDFDADDWTPEIHLGKSSMGWAFLLHVYPGKIDNWDEMVQYLSSTPGRIANEVGVHVTVADFVSIVESRRETQNRSYRDSYSFYCPKMNLHRSRVNERWCIANHESLPIDYITGYFS